MAWSLASRAGSVPHVSVKKSGSQKQTCGNPVIAHASVISDFIVHEGTFEIFYSHHVMTLVFVVCHQTTKQLPCPVEVVALIDVT